MRLAVGGGWQLYHVTDRVVELRKEDHAYRRFTGRDGFVRVRVEPEMTRAMAIERALEFAQKNDELLALKVSKRLMPSKHALAAYQGKAIRMERAFATNEDPELIGAKHV